MKNLIKDIKKALDALAFADFGELQTDERKAQLLNALPPATPLQIAGAARSAGKHVVLAMRDRLEPNAVKYAVSTCQRMDASLHVLSTAPQRVAEQAVAPHLPLIESAGVGHQIVVRPGTIEDAIRVHTRSQRGTLLVVAGSTSQIDPKLGRGLRGRRTNWKMDFPLVVVAESA